MKNKEPHQLKTISDYHSFRGLPKPEHPLISVVNLEAVRQLQDNEPRGLTQHFYSIALKRNFTGKLKYGQQEYDFNEGVMFFISPGQVYSIESKKALEHSGWLLFFHPDFLWNTPLAKTIKQYEYFSYAANEALHLSEKEEAIIAGIIQQIEQEYHSNIDKFSQSVIIAQLELLLTYAERFYHRQFITRKISSHKILTRLEAFLTAYFNSVDLIKKGLPTVQYIAQSLNVSPNYLSSLLKVLTGQNTQQHIHSKLIDIAKEKLSTTALSVSEIAYELGFEHPQSFSKLFKTKTNLSPLEFRQTFN
ncbi:AraC family transcriptional regulator [Chitinophaga sp. CF418]|uniref:helix-turn-helix domain-containing protein n=1 Tax=Chitinophaga sp. CF418 TaxID=1855287 RepID=UPI00091686A2|nr:AraC family transcriptional regulator [Chitinophaga sp. CF418]SHN38716.1 transcriptional regulator, AraC family [Chitinophaga sp. CF418]